VLLATISESIRLALEVAESVLVISHVGPDGDAIASLAATGLALEQLGKRFSLVCDDGLPERFTYLPMSDRITSAPSLDTTYDLILALDAGDESRLGNAFALLPGPRPDVINIDHHITNTNFGAINLVRPEATSTVEVLFELFASLNLRLDEPMAVCLLSGLVTDTLGFRTASVSGRTLQIASQLVEAGADLYEVMNKALALIPMSTLLLWQRGLNNMHLEDGLLWTSISKGERVQTGYEGNGSSGLGNMLARVYQAPVSAVLVELEDGRVSVSFRCRPPYSVSELAVSLGGGGHHLASGCTIDGPLDAAAQLVIARATASIRGQRSSFSH
jgi:phosphoesterase RecJ-like protein